MGNAQSTSGDSLVLRGRGSRQSTSNQGNSETRSPAIMKRPRQNSSDSVSDFGWYEDTETNSAYNSFTSEHTRHPMHKALTLPAPACEPPLYILESSLETQQLWYATAGRRPPQPKEEREKYEKLWSQNFESSAICFDQQPSTSGGVDQNERTECPHEVMYRGRPPFSNSVSKSFSGQTISSMTIQLPYFRIVRDRNGVLFAEYLILVSLGGRGSVTFGVWKRHSEFDSLAKLISEMDERAPKAGMFKNALLSWQCVLQRKRWFKSLDTEYLAVKCFLLERFMQDLLFEVSSASLICEFLGLGC